MSSFQDIVFIETIRAENGKMPLLDFHLQRLQWGLWQYGITNTAPLLDTFMHSLEHSTPKNGIYKLRCLLILSGIKPEIIVEAEPLPPKSQSINIGVFTGQPKKHGHFWNAKTSERQVYSAAMQHAKNRRWDDAIVLSEDGSVADTCIYNLFVVMENVLYTPPLSSLPVKGVMREWIKRNGIFPVIDRKMYPEDLSKADCLLVCNAIRGILLARLVT
jgi:para-aminobenzoate synthetase/4-amino-4-deoxychorismate lyase